MARRGLGLSALVCIALHPHGSYGATSPDHCTAERCRAPVRQTALMPSLLQVEKRRSLSLGTGDGFEPVDGGVGRACRPTNSSGDFGLIPGTPDLETCKTRCRETHGCRGIEYGRENGRCEVWTAPGGVSGSAAVAGYTCLRYAGSAHFEFSPADGGTNRVCRGASHDDNSPEYWKLLMGIRTLEACKAECVSTPGCKGIEFRSNNSRCEVWKRPLGVGVTKEKEGYSCWRYSPSTTTTTTVAPPVTKEGCTCISSWVMDDFPDSPCLNYCCNPDGAPGGPWCFVHNDTCQGSNWGYCASKPPPARPVEPRPPVTYPGFPLHVLPIEWEHFGLVNRLRASGFQCPGGQRFPPNPEPLKFDCRLWRASRGHSKDMADRDYFGEEGPGTNDLSPWDRAWRAGISPDLLHIAAACDTATCVFDKWKESDRHCNNLLQASFKIFGVGVAFNASSMYKYYWTELFKEDEVEVDTSCYPPLRFRS
mmetsp:Transcript_36728/g.85452  ORF Transcript_36728/g.85452 Transcript_36728/m.85452 type:complete len:479 (-) Transcript_36728:155-1591(-)